MDTRHEFLISSVAEYLSLDVTDVVDAMLEGTQIEQMDVFFEADGPTKLIFFCQDADSSTDAGW